MRYEFPNYRMKLIWQAPAAACTWVPPVWKLIARHVDEVCCTHKSARIIKRTVTLEVLLRDGCVWADSYQPQVTMIKRVELRSGQLLPQFSYYKRPNVLYFYIVLILLSDFFFYYYIGVHLSTKYSIWAIYRLYIDKWGSVCLVVLKMHEDSMSSPSTFNCK